MRVVFPYLRRGDQWFPVVDISLRGPRGRPLTLAALVDSGATYSVFRPEVADALGLAIERGVAVPLEGIGGRILGYRHRVDATVAGRRFPLIVVFSRELTVSFSIVGRSNFFRHFCVTFDEAAKRVVLER